MFHRPPPLISPLISIAGELLISHHPRTASGALLLEGNTLDKSPGNEGSLQVRGLTVQVHRQITGGRMLPPFLEPLSKLNGLCVWSFDGPVRFQPS
jgi:hypothetical protein